MGERCGFMWEGCSGGGVQVGGSVGGGVERNKGENIRGIEGSKGQILGGGLNGIFLQFEFRFRNGLGATLALQSFCITHLIKAERAKQI